MKEKGSSPLFTTFTDRELAPEAESAMLKSGKRVRSGAAA